MYVMESLLLIIIIIDVITTIIMILIIIIMTIIMIIFIKEHNSYAPCESRNAISIRIESISNFSYLTHISASKMLRKAYIEEMQSQLCTTLL